VARLGRLGLAVGQLEDPERRLRKIISDVCIYSGITGSGDDDRTRRWDISWTLCFLDWR
jgi:hypothetical protein